LIFKEIFMSEQNSDKTKALQAALAQIEKQFGKGTIMRLGEGEVIEDIQVVSTGSLGLDIALGVGGLPRGRVVEIYGPESSGKTTLTLQVIAEMQKLAVNALSSMPNTHWTFNTLKSWALTCKTCSSANPIPANKP
jgi:protein RecA